MSAPRSKRVDGWMMTADQKALFFRLWSAACAGQGWNRLSVAEREQKRHEILLELGFSSAKHIDPTEGFDAVKEALERLVDVLRNEPEDARRRRRVAWCAKTALAKLRAAAYPEHSIETLLADRFKVIPGLRTIEELSTRDLLELTVTLKDRLATWNLRDSFPAAALTIAKIAAVPGVRLADSTSPEQSRGRNAHATPFQGHSMPVAQPLQNEFFADSANLFAPRAQPFF